MFWPLLWRLKDSFASDLDGNAILKTRGVKPVPLNGGCNFKSVALRFPNKSGATVEHRDPLHPVCRLRKIQCISQKTGNVLRRWLHRPGAKPQAARPNNRIEWTAAAHHG